jgi:hypothetical protein
MMFSFFKADYFKTVIFLKSFLCNLIGSVKFIINKTLTIIDNIRDY